MPETFLDGRVTLHCGDSREVLRTLPDASIHAVVCDPPYALESIRKRFGGAGAAPAQHGRDGLYARASVGFMGQAWDTGETAFAPEFWAEVLRVLKPGGHVVAFGGTRTYHRLACAIEDAGFEIRDSILELAALDPIVGAFVASLDDAQLSAFLRVMDLLGVEGLLAWVYGTGFNKRGYIFKDESGQPEGPWGGALKPAWEPIVIARKPLAGTVAETVLAHGTGALNIDGCRVGTEGATTGRGASRKSAGVLGDGLNGWSVEAIPGLGRWPANVVHDGSPEVVDAFPDTGAGGFPSVHGPGGIATAGNKGQSGLIARATDSGSASRFFYSAKADADDRIGSKHPTVKPIDLMQWLCRLVTPPGGVVLDPFAGTGTTGEAAWREGFSAVLIEREAAYQADIRRRMALALAGPAERKRESVKARGLAADNDHGPLFGGLDAVGGGGRSTENSPGTDNRPDRAQKMSRAAE